MAKNTKAPFKKRVGRLLRRGVIISALMRFADFICKTARNSFAASILLSYDKAEECAESSLAGSIAQSLGSSESVGFRKVKHRIASALENSFIISSVGKLSSALLTMSLASYGVFAFSFGFYVVATYLLKKYSFAHEVSLASLITGIAFIALSFVLFMSKKSLAQAISDSAIMRFVFFDVLSLRSVTLDYAASCPATAGISVSFIFGMVCGTVSIFVPAEYVLLAIAAKLLNL